MWCHIIRKYYKETEGTMLDCGTFAKALEVSFVAVNDSLQFFITSMHFMHCINNNV